MPDTAATVRVLTGLVFVGGGIAKFAFNGWEVDAFESFHLPLAEVFVVAVGIAIVVSGFGHGDVIPSLTLAPLLLAASLWLSLRPEPR